ncbi:eukaryotic elongation factor 2 kinase isoform X2 [Hyalella azteca]|uniref:Eukaryotic elongation factor 2 kinase isoform X2 n=1 Tax=Hyalella azteca TaxID=294128 RepID=A0A8B7NJA6_HYAAZ|nr:eukaryotic elongation factor 2 kinase isoform X2 [Hyalella azteca]
MGLAERSISESSDDIVIRPLELADLQRGISSDEPQESPRRKRDGENLDACFGLLGSQDKFFSVVYGLSKKDGHSAKHKMLARMAWKNAYNKVKAMRDPWEKFDIAQFRMEKARRHRYKALQKKWVTDEVLVKMDTAPFSHGAMRECFRMKKLSNFCHDDWSKAHNYVAKRYMNEATPPQTYYDDVKLQMDAKLWGEEYNRHNPPKKVDIFQMAVLELLERPGCPLFHVEHFIEGSYVKYNSNSGYVSSSKMRMTPHAFSHFTFERSGHELIVVDVQGVGDLYTDPQIHTAHGTEYGDGNLGTRGMALFFHSHVCNSICHSLGLSQFDLAPSEITKLQRQNRTSVSSKTRVRGTEEHVTLPTEEQRLDLNEYLRQRSQSSGCSTQEDDNIIADLNIASCESLDESVDESEDSAVAMSASRPRFARGPRIARRLSNPPGDEAPKDAGRRRRSGNSESAIQAQQTLLLAEADRQSAESLGVPSICNPPQPRLRFDSSSSECDSITRADMVNFSAMVTRRSRPSRIMSPELQRDFLLALDVPRHDSVNIILGQVHLDMAKYYELNRFNEEGENYDRDAAVFHVMQAAHCGLVEGLLAAAQLLLGLPHYILPDTELSEAERDQVLGFAFLEEACRAGDRWSIIYVATALEQGIALPPGRSRNWVVADVLYERALTGSGEDDEGGYDAVMETPNYLLKARQAAMYLQGGHGLIKDPNRAGELYSEAAQLATEAMKGKLAAKYYMDAELAWGECEE